MLERPTAFLRAGVRDWLWSGAGERPCDSPQAVWRGGQVEAIGSGDGGEGAAKEDAERAAAELNKCEPGYFSPTGQKPCEPCPAGSFMADAGGRQCVRCPHGSFQNHTGATACEQCEGDAVTRRLGATSAADCGEHAVVTGMQVMSLGSPVVLFPLPVPRSSRRLTPSARRCCRQCPTNKAQRTGWCSTARVRASGAPRRAAGRPGRGTAGGGSQCTGGTSERRPRTCTTCTPPDCCLSGSAHARLSSPGRDETCPISTGGRDETCPISTGGRWGWLAPFQTPLASGWA